MLESSYNEVLVACSIIVAILASYTALNMASRVTSASGRTAVLWLVGGSFAMGFGIWSMHFVGMLAFSLPIDLGYNVPLTLLSLLIAIASSALALYLVCHDKLPWSRLLSGGTLMGLGMASMHYIGMEAMLMNPYIFYVPWLVGLFIIIAIIASVGALWLAFRLREEAKWATFSRMGAALVMGCAIIGMHYTGMAASRFPLNSFCGAANSGIDTKWLAVLVIIVSLAVFAIALIVSMLDVRTNRLSNSLDDANNELIKLALHDNLTGLPNRVLLGDRLEQAIHRAERNESEFAVLFLDLDGFKAINDMHGHHVGDLLLKEVAHRLLVNKREGDTAARLGGDEFVLLLEPCTPGISAAFAQRLIDAIEQPYEASNNLLQISTSIGIAIYPQDGQTEHEVMVNADGAMYHAKKQGRNGYCFFEHGMNADVHLQMQMQQNLRQAVDRNELVLHYQPKVIAPNGPMAGLEALLRWQSPDYGFLSPDRFLPLAESSGLIVSIGNWVINEACQQMKIWYDQGHRDWSIAVNLSAVQLEHDSLLDVVRLALTQHSLAPSHLVLEVTESTAMRDAETSLKVLNELSALGVSISIDDFGTGYSSLLYLKRLPANELKIDRGFITELAQGNDDEAIIKAIIALGKTLGMTIVAEGVETSDQQELLTRLGCDTLQGYLLARPVAPDKLLETITHLSKRAEPTPVTT
ncbi:EAL domain-containing protein [Marinobacter sp. M3C]|jgi:diguanylate cyclase (GGDEF)-like protein|uniref:putative bifunctional diguanylate cyclase/phosphodiesterase n=1 Tax=unclassified Marinobacter TaxID=83889 RepID=UPI00200DF2AA|nr:MULTISPECIES: bifunctional diguanylate cyclase/phosphodiesterase [unclassified Marinobacter]MCL1481802.1 EAL domain-containing protein [Marinobacter sp.]UQG54953.1 EAL domain-containing protein [Marinobacter sp. M4C]UQG59673.1 EAL domain-containing protein [Marinobacter sp. M3C]UQG63754.1 EAL domain-containing protein [Marinobacter sp. M2C]UQG68037.1 EAL domain-containing protein [Marinobacter sp. M1C]